MFLGRALTQIFPRYILAYCQFLTLALTTSKTYFLHSKKSHHHSYTGLNQNK